MKPTNSREFTQGIDRAELLTVDVYCKCHDPACSGQGHCQDNVSPMFARRPTRQDTLEWLAANSCA
jgi:hypothetical protein